MAPRHDPVSTLWAEYDPRRPRETVEALRQEWLRAAPRPVKNIKASQQQLQQTVGIPVPVLKALGQSLAKQVKSVEHALPLAKALWVEGGREGRVVAVQPLGRLGVLAPAKLVSELRALCATCLTWEDADLFAMYALEPLVLKQPEAHLATLRAWTDDESPWVRRAAVTVAGRLAMKKRGALVPECLRLVERLLGDDALDVKRATSFALRLAARGDLDAVAKFLDTHVPPRDAAATWVLCDAIRSMSKAFLPKLRFLAPRYRRWAAADVSATERRSIEAAAKLLER
ncbi:MAG: DNA alkylation repair protein [Myxococcota bacterium]